MNRKPRGRCRDRETLAISASPPPHNLEAEQSVLGSMLLDRDAIARAVEELRPEDFYHDAHRVIFSAILDLFERGDPVDLITVSNRLASMGKLDDVVTLEDADGSIRVGRVYLVSLPNVVVSTANVASYIAIVREKSKLRALIACANNMSARAHEGAEAAADLARDHQHALDLLDSERSAGALSGVSLVRASDVQSEKVSWAWADRFPFGALTILAGEPGLGKSSIALEMCARWTRGQLPGDASETPFPVVIASAEDHRSAVLVPRLTAAGADLHCVHFVDVHTTEGLPRGLVLPDDLPTLEARLRETGARALVVDPLVAYLPGTVNSWRDQDVRRALAPLTKMAETFGVAVACVVHLNKSNATEVLARVSGSVGIVAAARSLFLVARDPEDEKTCLFAHAKSNLSLLAPTMRFRIEGREVSSSNGTIATSGVAWLGEAPNVRACDLLPRGDAADCGEIQEAMEWLRDAMSQGPRPANEIDAQAQNEGISRRTLERAKKVLGVKSRRYGYRAPWVWELPSPQGRQGGDEDCQYPEVGGLRADACSKAFSDKAPTEDRQVSDIGDLREEGAGDLGQEPGSLQPPFVFDRAETLGANRPPGFVGSLDGRRTSALALARERRFPPVQLGPGRRVAGGEDAWQKFTSHPGTSDADLDAAIAGVQMTSPETGS